MPDLMYKSHPDSEMLSRRFRGVLPRDTLDCHLRYVREQSEQLQIRRDILQPPRLNDDAGVMITWRGPQSCGYAATSDLTASGLKAAIEKARSIAEHCQGHHIDIPASAAPSKKKAALGGSYANAVAIPWSSVSNPDKIDRLQQLVTPLPSDKRIVDWEGWFWHVRWEQILLSHDGDDIRQQSEILIPYLSVTASDGSTSQGRSFGGMRGGRQGGLEILDRIAIDRAPERLSRESLELLQAPQCPTGKMDLLLAPDQMVLQIHESIGHPLELDRILGDERNYAGTSFVTPDMFGNYRYGSDLLDIDFAPDVETQIASYAFDDDGTPASSTPIISRGQLLCPLGGITSQRRAGMPGVANARSCSWNRPPIDRMANLNMRPGSSSLDDMIRSVDRGVMMEGNNSWSIDDARNKFQFGCEYARQIENGKLGPVVKNPCYRGISATFWRNLKMVGNASTREILGTPNCGKGEPNQMIRVGHATPAALFSEVDIFGGE